MSKAEAADGPEQLPGMLPEDAFLDFTRHIMGQSVHKGYIARLFIAWKAAAAVGNRFLGGEAGSSERLARQRGWRRD